MFSSKHKYIVFEINACKEEDMARGQTCASRERVAEWINKHPINIVYKDMYKDSSDAYEPIKSFVNDPFQVPLGISYTKNMDFFVMNGEHQETGKFLPAVKTPIF